MDQIAARKYVGIDFTPEAVLYSVYDEGQNEIAEDRLPLSAESGEDRLKEGVRVLRRHVEDRQIRFADYSGVNITMDEASADRRKTLLKLLPEAFYEGPEPTVITHFRAFAEYVFHQEKAMWDRNTLLLEYTGSALSGIRIDQIRRSRQKAYRATVKEIDLNEYDVIAGDPDQDSNFARMIKQFLVRNPANIIFLTGEGFEGNWMKKTLNILCAGRRVFLGQNLYANGACLMGIRPIPFMEEGLLLMDGPDMVCHTVGVVAVKGGKPDYVPITTIGKEWYNTSGNVDIILDKSQRVEIFFHNTKENEMEGMACEIKDLPKRPPKTTRVRVSVEFHSATEGIIMLKDMGFGEMFPGTGKITLLPFTLIS